MAKGRLLLVVNLHASRAKASLGGAVACLAGSGFDLDIRQSADGDSLASVIRDCAGSADAIVVAGGDGTVNGAIPALIEAKKPVGILPFGTANDLALTLGIPVDPVAAAERDRRPARPAGSTSARSTTPTSSTSPASVSR